MDAKRIVAIALVLLAVAWNCELVARAERMGVRETAAEIASLDFLSVQVRRMIANLLWVRVDDYMHSSDVVSFKSKEAPQGVEKGVSAHLAAREIQALARLVTTFDPAFVRAGVALGNLRMRDPAAQAATTEFLLGMIRGNPEHPRLYALYATLGSNAFQREDYASARGYLERAFQLYPRVREADRLALLGDGPEDETDQFMARSILARLVSCLVELHDYETATKYWAKSDGWDPNNKSIRLILMYNGMKARKAIDMAELTAAHERFTKEEQDRALSIGQANSGDEVDEILGGLSKRFEVKPQELKLIDLGLPEPLVIKLAAVLALALGTCAVGFFQGWLRR